MKFFCEILKYVEGMLLLIRNSSISIFLPFWQNFLIVKKCGKTVKKKILWYRNSEYRIILTKMIKSLAEIT